MTKIIALDLDGILIDKPPLIPKSVVEFFYKDQSAKKLSYRYPCFFEQKIRQITHLPGIRPLIKKNYEIIKDLSKKGKYQFYLISSRFSFLEKLTLIYLRKYHLTPLFKKIFLNTEDLQPHIYKERLLKKLKIDLFIDDDFDTICYLAKKFKKIHFYWYTQEQDRKLNAINITPINNLGTILK